MKVTDDMISNEIDATEKSIQLEKHKTNLKKSEFIREIKSGLGNEIKSNPNAIKVLKKPWHKRLKMFLSKIFTRF
jgi:hypothetical protein